jgi:hypothetical protein
MNTTHKKYSTSIDHGHDHQYKLGKNRTKNAVYYDELSQSKYRMHHHPITYENKLPIIGMSQGHNHQS